MVHCLWPRWFPVQKSGVKPRNTRKGRRQPPRRSTPPPPATKTVRGCGGKRSATPIRITRDPRQASRHHGRRLKAARPCGQRRRRAISVAHVRPPIKLRTERHLISQSNPGLCRTCGALNPPSFRELQKRRQCGESHCPGEGCGRIRQRQPAAGWFVSVICCLIHAENRLLILRRN